MKNQQVQNNQINNIGIQTQPEAQSAPAKVVSKLGLLAALLSIVNGIAILQKNSTGLLGLSAELAKRNSEFSRAWVKYISTGPDSIQAQITAEANSSDNEKVKSAKMSALQAKYQQATTNSEQSKTFWTSLTDAAQQRGSASSEAIDTFSDIGQSALSTETTIANLLA